MNQTGRSLPPADLSPDRSPAEDVGAHLSTLSGERIALDKPHKAGEGRAADDAPGAPVTDDLFDNTWAYIAEHY